MFASAAAIYAAALVTVAADPDMRAETPADEIAATSIIMWAQGASPFSWYDEAVQIAQAYNHDELCAAWRRVKALRADFRHTLMLQTVEQAVRIREMTGAW